MHRVLLSPLHHGQGRADGAARRLAFTLLELLVVVGIVALLAGLLVPSLLQARQLARRAACSANLSGVGKAAAQYQADHRWYVPISWRNYDSTYPNPWKSWRTCLLPYVASYETHNCPAAEDVPGGSLIFHSVEEVTTTQAWGGTGAAGCYGVIYQKSLPTFQTEDVYGTVRIGHPGQSPAYPVEPGVAWREPGRSVYAADSCIANGPVTYPTVAYKGLGASIVIPPSEAWYTDGTTTYRFADRHLGTCCLFVDGHVESHVTSALDAMKPGEADCVWDVE